jgi:drug/metabolite transporter (DMT)-like permease
MIVVLALASAFTYGAGVALQHREAALMPATESVRFGLLLRLVRRPLWLLGVAADFVAFVLQAAALSRGALVIVEPLVATSLVFSLVIVAVLQHTRLNGREIGAAFLVVTGLSIFLLVGAPDIDSHDLADSASWFACGFVLGGLVVAVSSWGVTRRGRARAGGLAVAAGLTNGFVAVVSKAFAQRLDEAGLVETLHSWQPWALAACAVVDTLLIQSAYQADVPTLTFPLIEVTGPLTAAMIGLVMFGEHVSLGQGRAVVVLMGLAVMVVGIVALGRDPLLAEGSSPPTDPVAP